MIVLLPVHQPSEKLPALVGELRAAAPDLTMVVVDDGSSGPAPAEALRAARDLGCTVLRHRRNLGKGVALRTGFRYVIRTWPGQDVVCADGDGQHRTEDILRVARRVRETGRMVLGVRRFTGRVPLRSRVGNEVTRLLFRAVTGCPVRDTQTGLRGHPAAQLDWLLTVPGDRFDYEMAVLLAATRTGEGIEQTPVATRYVANNASSHFSSVVDSARVYRPLLRFAVSPRSATRPTAAEACPVEGRPAPDATGAERARPADSPVGGR
ncbi:glycosyltransferase family 2 protein [Micromonospora siamensis]|uniref:Glycosyltransferase involved in cell wall bisynthesis n=1 Tax=Micromonospora siamensis TaxID=299152 RepID=A0A1C5HYJ3_9ACTN|nr:glycosyltransferase family 2 protein [Micromonospora siamensis]SCG50671.1 Glycosyltransferase involved in cell wall bisynthesis [Micromonospora siamensis]